MEIINRRLTVHEFEDYINGYYFGTKPANRLVIHHTWRPTTEQWQGQISINGLKSYYEGKGWPAGPHLFIAEDGIWLFSQMRKDGIHAAAFNHRTIGIEIVGDYDNQIWKGQTKYNALGAIRSLAIRLNLKEEDVLFHRDSSPKTCPGSTITKQWLFDELRNYRTKPRFPRPAESITSTVSDWSGRANPITDGIPTPAEDEVLIPIWASDAVSFVLKHRIFEIRTDDDVRDAVKFYRFYQIVKNNIE